MRPPTGSGRSCAISTATTDGTPPSRPAPSSAPKARTVSAACADFGLADGSELREQLLALSDLEQSFSYCLLDTPIPLFNYVAHVRLLPVTDGDRTFWHWELRFTDSRGRREAPGRNGRRGDLSGWIEAIREHLREAV